MDGLSAVQCARLKGLLWPAGAQRVRLAAYKEGP